MKKNLMIIMAAATLTVVSFGDCFAGNARRDRRRLAAAYNANRYTGYGNYGIGSVQNELYSVHGMLRDIAGKLPFDVDFGILLDCVKEEIFDTYVIAKGGRPQSSCGGSYDLRTYHGRDKHVKSFDSDYVVVFRELDNIRDQRFESFLAQADPLIDRAVSLVIARQVALKAGAKTDQIRDLVMKELRKQGIFLRGGRKTGKLAAAPAQYGQHGQYKLDQYGFPQEQESVWKKVGKIALYTAGGVAAAGAVAYGAYAFGAKKDEYKNKGFWKWLLPKSGTGFFSLKSDEDKDDKDGDDSEKQTAPQQQADQTQTEQETTEQ